MPEHKTLYEVATEIYERCVAAHKMDLAKELEPWEIVCNARVHLANGPMTSGDADAWELMGWIQCRLMNPEEVVCHEEFTHGQSAHNCTEAVVSWCGDCGAMLCKTHLRRCCMESRCDGCHTVHESTFHKWLDTQIN